MPGGFDRLVDKRRKNSGLYPIPPPGFRGIPSEAGKAHVRNEAQRIPGVGEYIASQRQYDSPWQQGKRLGRHGGKRVRYT